MVRCVCGCLGVCVNQRHLLPGRRDGPDCHLGDATRARLSGE